MALSSHFLRDSAAGCGPNGLDAAVTRIRSGRARRSLERACPLSHSRERREAVLMARLPLGDLSDQAA
jgi:hypothetical protein